MSVEQAVEAAEELESPYFEPEGFSGHYRRLGSSSIEDGSELRVYLMLGDKRSETLLKQAGAQAVRLSGFRLIALGPVTLDLRPIKRGRLVGYQPASAWKAAESWVDSNILDDLHEQYLQSEGPVDVSPQTTRYAELQREIERTKATLSALEMESSDLAKELVKLWGRKPLYIAGVLHDPSHARETVYFKRRRGTWRGPSAGGQ